MRVDLRVQTGQAVVIPTGGDGTSCDALRVIRVDLREAGSRSRGLQGRPLR